MRGFAFVTECEGEPPYLLRFAGWYDDHAVKGADGQWRFQRRTVRLWDGEVLKNFPGRGQWVARKRPESRCDPQKLASRAGAEHPADHQRRGRAAGRRRSFRGLWRRRRAT